MKLFSLLAIVTLVSWVGTMDVVHGYETAVVFPMSSVEHVDLRNQLLTFKTREGHLWTLRVADPAAMKREPLTKGDLVSIEVDLDDQIVKIVKVANASGSGNAGSRGR